MPQIAVINAVDRHCRRRCAEDAACLLAAMEPGPGAGLGRRPPPTLPFIPKNQMPAAGSWWLVFLDNSDQAGALAYHDLTNDGLPISKVFVKTLQGGPCEPQCRRHPRAVRDGGGPVAQQRLPGPQRRPFGRARCATRSKATSTAIRSACPRHRLRHPPTGTRTSTVARPSISRTMRITAFAVLPSLIRDAPETLPTGHLSLYAFREQDYDFAGAALAEDM